MHIASEEFASHYHMPEIKVLFEKQWKKSYHPVFSAAALMNPAYHIKFGYTALWNDAGVQDDMKTMIGRFFYSSAAEASAMAQLSQYKRWQGYVENYPQKRSFRLADYHPLWGVLISGHNIHLPYMFM